MGKTDGYGCFDTSSLCYLGLGGLGYRHSEITEVVVGFAATGDGQNDRQGAAFARAAM